MSHTCPDCGYICYCSGDIDDCMFDDDEDVINCTHYEKCGGDDPDEYEYDPDDDLEVSA